MTPYLVVAYRSSSSSDPEPRKVEHVLLLQERLLLIHCQKVELLPCKAYVQAHRHGCCFFLGAMNATRALRVASLTIDADVLFS